MWEPYETVKQHLAILAIVKICINNRAGETWQTWQVGHVQMNSLTDQQLPEQSPPAQLQ